MKYCSNHHENPDDAIFCTECGEKLESSQLSKSKKCPKCAANNPQDAEFCHNCGYEFSEAIKPIPNVNPTQKVADPVNKPSTNSTHQASKISVLSKDESFSDGVVSFILGLIIMGIGFWIDIELVIMFGIMGIVSGIVVVLRNIYKYLKDRF